MTASLPPTPPPGVREPTERDRRLARVCGLCGHQMTMAGCGHGQADDVDLCHHDTHSCYHLWTVYGKRPAPAEQQGDGLLSDERLAFLLAGLARRQPNVTQLIRDHIAALSAQHAAELTAMREQLVDAYAEAAGTEAQRDAAEGALQRVRDYAERLGSTPGPWRITSRQILGAIEGTTP